MKEKSLYIHIPFCKQKCLYCDFTSFVHREEFMDDYIEALSSELLLYKDNIFKTVYIGGGTPTFLNIKNLNKLSKVIGKLKLTEDVEFSCEGNPGTFTEEKLRILKAMGVNRLSIGLQSFDNGLLKILGRIHDADEFLKSFNMARNEGFNNINIDIMFGLPNQKIDDLKDTLEKVIKLNPEHISAYSLIVEEGTPFYKLYEDRKSLPTEEEEREMYNYILESLKKNSYFQYEISNFSKPNKECLHNIVYWDLKEYVGCGLGAHSFLNQTRRENTHNIKEYMECLRQNRYPIIEEHKNTKKDSMEEFMFMGLRKIKGVNKEKFYENFKMYIEDVYKEVIDKYKRLNLLEEDKQYLRLTKRGIELSNVVMADFILD
ncbi:radical SAM family heme chaperone HemW [Hathewaya limosa]|uniref:Heme chaperone HemW n=2 Tax=Hathewaya limosa TaxID=1536 RepID=A0ABU0JRL7_HATLI|nr:radical SAM family heme chaperone HemW [Hathewaya limosa]MDQ0478901.1 oxygen-independent coproporphyrinogen-3 oxidase [Hathewaya limosa]